MKLVIDLQGRQSEVNKFRGIGRYSLSITKSMIRNKKNHYIVVVLSSAFPDEVLAIKDELKGLLPAENIIVWDVDSPVSYLSGNSVERKKAELRRELFIKSLSPDVVYITSLFEGLNDNVVSSVGDVLRNIPVAVTLYDLIPLIHQDIYLDSSPPVKQWYMTKLESLKSADLLLAISESSRGEALNYLGKGEESVVNISTSADSQFCQIELNEAQRLELLSKYGIKNGYLMYTGGIDHRKNIEGLIQAYAMLPKAVREQHQLAIVCSIDEHQMQHLGELVASVGLTSHEVIFTGFISEDDLIGLYNLCTAFIFPSWHEGFGLPALEAMCCGAAVIAANTSSLPEVVGCEAALFDPNNTQDMAHKIEHVLTDSQFRKALREQHKVHRQQFSWDISGKKAIEALEVAHENHTSSPPSTADRLKLAFVSPLPPERSGISDYSAELLPYLSIYYDIDVIVEQDEVSDPWIQKNCNIVDVASFKATHESYERILYHFGNSSFHQYMFELLSDISGVVVLHDFFLSGVLNWMSVHQYSHTSIEQELYYSHGNGPFNNLGVDLILHYPCNKKVLNDAKGLIFHSHYSNRLLEEWYGKHHGYAVANIPLLRRPCEQGSNHVEIRRALGLPSDALIVASFGMLGMTKQNHRLLEAWLASEARFNSDCYLIFVGENCCDDYGKKIETMIAESDCSERIIITGWTENEEFRQYLMAADIGVQLRTLSRGETSATVLDCMNHGLATIVNANGSMADLDSNAVMLLKDEFSQNDLVDALNTLHLDKSKRQFLGRSAKAIVREHHSPEHCAYRYMKEIESFYERNVTKRFEFKEVVQLSEQSRREAELLKIIKQISDAMNAIHSSTSWKIARKIQKIVMKFRRISGAR